MTHERPDVSRRGVLAGAAGGLALAGTPTGARDAGAWVGTGANDWSNPDEAGPVEAVVRLNNPGSRDRPAADDTERLRRAAAESVSRFRTRVRDRPGVTVERRFWLANAVLVTVDTARTSVEELEGMDVVEGVEPNADLPAAPDAPDTDGPAEVEDAAASTTDPTVAALPTEGTAETTYGLDMVNAPLVWDFYGTRGAGVDVCVVGTGVDPTGHDGIGESLDRGGWAEFDESGERLDTDPRDPEGHGTSVSSVVVGETTDEGVRYGVAPDANLYVARRARSYASALAAFDWAVENEVDVLSLSWGQLDYNGTLATALENARAAGTLVVGSVGNAGRYTSATLGNLPTTVGVGAVDRDEAVPEWSGGERIHTARYWDGAAPEEWPETYTVPRVTAPGVDLPIAQAGGGYETTGGTSIATPLAAGAAALVLSATDVSDPAEAAELLTEAARHPASGDSFAVDPGADDRHGAGVVDALGAASRANATASVAGRVTDENGDPIEGATVVSEAGVMTRTDGAGQYTLAAPPGEQPVGAVALGHELAFEMVDPAERDRLDLSLPATTSPDVDLRDGLPTRVDPGDSATGTFAVANVESVTVDAEATGPLRPDDLTLVVAGQEAGFGDPVTFDSPRDADALDISVETASSARPGRFRLSVRFDGEGGPVGGTLDGVHVHPEVVNLDPSVPSIQAAVDLVAPDTVLALESGSYEESPADGAPGALVLDKPVSVVSRSDATPEIVASGDAGTAVQVTANDVKLAGLTVDAGGADATVRAGVGFSGRETVAPSGLTVRENTLTGAAAAVVTDWAPAAEVEANTVTAGRTGVDVRDDQTTAVVANDIRGVETGVHVGGAATEVSGNVVADVDGPAIHVETSRLAAFRMGPIADNEIEAVAKGIVVDGRTSGGIENNRLTDVTGTAIEVAGVVGGGIRGNRIDGADVGLDLRGGTVAGPVTDNRFRNVDRKRLGDGGGSEATPGSATGTAGPGGTPRGNATGTGTSEGRAPADSSADVLLFAATALSMGVLLVPFGLRRYRRR